MKQLLYFITLLISFFSYAQLDNIKAGEQLKYRIHYGFINAGYATLTTSKTNYKGEPHLYVKGYGRTTGATRFFFKVEDHYESYINLGTGLPSYYVRNVKEGNYTQHLTATFNHDDQTLILTDKKTPTNAPKTIKTVAGIQDMLSVFYHLRGLSKDELKVGSIKNMNVWIDDEMFAFHLKIIGIETISTKFGKVSALKIHPLVKDGRVFKSKESVTLWVSNDQNHIPLAIKAELAVGSLRADIESFNNVKYPIQFVN